MPARPLIFDEQRRLALSLPLDAAISSPPRLRLFSWFVFAAIGYRHFAFIFAFMFRRFRH